MSYSAMSNTIKRMFQAKRQITPIPLKNSHAGRSNGEEIQPSLRPPPLPLLQIRTNSSAKEHYKNGFRPSQR